MWPQLQCDTAVGKGRLASHEQTRSHCLRDPQQPPPPRICDNGSKHEECRDAWEDERHPKVPLQGRQTTYLGQCCLLMLILPPEAM